MFRRIGLVSLGLLVLTAGSAAAQERVEASFNVGYSVSEGITANQRPLLGLVFDTLAVDSGASINFTLGVNLTPKAQVEFLWGRQNSRLQADGPNGKLPISELVLYNYMGNFVYTFGERESKVRPYVFAGIGATQYSFGRDLLEGATGNLSSETRFSTNAGGGVKFYFTPKIGAKAGVRWTPTYISSNAVGIWCDPFYGCWPIADTQYSNQFETAGGITVRFE
jgi:opacity protein-like surface antigen